MPKTSTKRQRERQSGRYGKKKKMKDDMGASLVHSMLSENMEEPSTSDVQVPNDDLMVDSGLASTDVTLVVSPDSAAVGNRKSVENDTSDNVEDGEVIGDRPTSAHGSSRTSPQDGDVYGGKSQKKKPKTKETRPNCFIAIRFFDEKFLQVVTDVQRSLCEEEPSWEKCMIHKPKLHITMGLALLDTEDKINMACNVLHDAAEEIRELCPRSLTFRDLGTFRNSVVFLKLLEVDEMKILHNFVQDKLIANGLATEGNDDFQPHLTLFKVSKQKSSRRYKPLLKKLDPDVYSMWRGVDFGSAAVHYVELVQMMGRGVDGWYPQLCAVPVFDVTTKDSGLGMSTHGEQGEPLTIDEPSDDSDRALLLTTSPERGVEHDVESWCRPLETEPMTQVTQPAAAAASVSPERSHPTALVQDEAETGGSGVLIPDAMVSVATDKLISAAHKQPVSNIRVQEPEDEGGCCCTIS